jgi:hypothetical protein
MKPKSLSQKKRLEAQLYAKEAEKLLPEKEDPRKISEQGWSFYEQVGRNQAIEDCKPIVIKLLKEIDDLKQKIPEPIDQYQADPNIT